MIKKVLREINPAATRPHSDQKHSAPFGSGPSPRGDRCRTARISEARAMSPAPPSHGSRGSRLRRFGAVDRVPER